MRCRECNVDLPDNYTACPLCGAMPSDDAVLIQGVRTAEYPKAKAEPFKRNPFPIFVAVWLGLSAISFLLYKLNMIEAYVSASVFCLIPCIWTLFIRPFLIKQLYAGNFIVMNLFPFALTCMVFQESETYFSTTPGQPARYLVRTVTSCSSTVPSSLRSPYRAAS